MTYSIVYDAVKIKTTRFEKPASIINRNELAAAVLRRTDENDRRGVAEHVLETFFLGRLGVGLLINVRQSVDVVGIIHHAHLPRLLVHAAGRVDAALHDGLQLFTFNRLVGVLADAATRHDGLDHGIPAVGLHGVGFHRTRVAALCPTRAQRSAQQTNRATKAQPKSPILQCFHTLTD